MLAYVNTYWNMLAYNIMRGLLLFFTDFHGFVLMCIDSYLGCVECVDLRRRCMVPIVPVVSMVSMILCFQ